MPESLQEKQDAVMPSDKSSRLCTDTVLPYKTASRVSSGEIDRLGAEVVCQDHLQMLLASFVLEYLQTGQHEFQST